MSEEPVVNPVENAPPIVEAEAVPADKTETQDAKVTPDESVVDKKASEEKPEGEVPEQKPQLKLTKRPRKATRQMQQKLHEQDLQIAQLRNQNDEILAVLKQARDGNVEAKAETKKAAPTPAAVQVTDHDRKIIEDWQADLADAKINSPEVYNTIKSIETSRSPISYLDASTKDALLGSDGLSPYDIHDLSVNYGDKIDEMIDQGLSPRQQLRKMRKWVDELHSVEKGSPSPASNKQAPKVAPPVTGVLKGKAETIQDKSADERRRDYHKRAGLA
jgi:hypothetical protein